MAEETDSQHDGLYGGIRQPNTPPQESDTEAAVTRETPIDEGNPEPEVRPTAGRAFGDNPDYNESRDIFNTLWQPIYCAEDFKQAIRFVKVHYPKSHIDHHFNEGGCNIPEQFPSTTEWTTNNQIDVIDT